MENPVQGGDTTGIDDTSIIIIDVIIENTLKTLDI
jgi:hypothetical protein